MQTNSTKKIVFLEFKEENNKTSTSMQKPYTAN